MTKRIVSLLIAALILLSLTALADPTMEDLTRKWYFSAVRVENTEYSCSVAGLNGYIELVEDGAVNYSMTDGPDAVDTQTGSWTVDGSVVTVTDDAGAQITLTYMTADGDVRLEGDIGGYVTILRTDPPEEIVLPEPDPNAELAAYEGSWELSHVAAGGVTVKASEFGLSGTLYVQLTGEAEASIRLEAGSDTSNEIATVFRDGALWHDMDDKSDKYQLCDDGSIALSQIVDGDESDLVLFFTKRD